MTNVKQALERFWHDEEGATAIEYGLMVALIAVVIIAAVTLLGQNLRDCFNYIAGCLGAGGCPSSGGCGVAATPP